MARKVSRRTVLKGLLSGLLVNNLGLAKHGHGAPAGGAFFDDPFSTYPTIYLDPVNGNDTWDGSSKVATSPHGPKLTLAACTATLTGSQGRIFCLNTGILTVSANVNWPVNTSSSINQIVLQGDPASSSCFKILLASGALLFPNQNNSVNGICFRKIEVYTNNLASPISGETALVWYGPDHICNGFTTQYCKLHDVYGTDNTGCVFFQGVHSNFGFYNTYGYNSYTTGGGGSLDHSNHNGALFFTYQTPNVVVENCDLSAAGSLLYLKRCSPSTGTINGWTIINTWFHGATGNTAILISEQGGGDVGGFFGIDIENNLFSGIGQCVNQVNNENTVQSSGITFAHNTIANDVPFASGFQAMTNITFHSNVVCDTTDVTALLDASSPNGYVNTIALWDYDSYYTPQGQNWGMDIYGASPHTFTSLATWETAFSVGARPELSANPDTHALGFSSLATNFPNFSTGNWTLAPGSVLKGTGMGGTDPGVNQALIGPGFT